MTDFGIKDGNVDVMKGVIWMIAVVYGNTRQRLNTRLGTGWKWFVDNFALPKSTGTALALAARTSVVSGT